MKNEVLPVEIQEMAKGVSVEKRNEVQNVLNKVFDGVSKMREQLDVINVQDENDKVNMKLANTIRLGVRQVRLDANEIFDAKRFEVQQRMSSDKAEDSLWLKAKQIKDILTKEIEENARWKEETAKRFETEQKEIKTQKRENSVNKFNTEILRNEFENMGDETFNTFLSGIEKSYNDKIEAEKADAKRIEDERISKEKAIEAQRLENERLKKEAEKLAKIELDKIKAVKIKKQKFIDKLIFDGYKSITSDVYSKDGYSVNGSTLESLEIHEFESRLKEVNSNIKFKKEAEEKAKAIEAKAKKEREMQAIKDAKIQAENDAKLKAEKDAKAKIEKELKSIKEAEEKAKKEDKEKSEALRLQAIKDAKAPLKDKMNRWVSDFELPKTDVENEVSKEITSKFEAFKKWSITQVSKL